jgi:hypothetical protein
MKITDLLIGFLLVIFWLLLVLIMIFFLNIRDVPTLMIMSFIITIFFCWNILMIKDILEREKT